MRVARVLTGFAAVTALTLAPTRDARACSCGTIGPPCQNAFEVDAVFAGTVRNVSAPSTDGARPQPGEMWIPRAVRVELAEVVTFRGVDAPTVSVLTAGSSTACGVAFKQGERYLVYATRAPDGRGLVTSLCSRTRRLADADEDVRFLDTLSQATDARARVYGTVTHWERDLATGAPLDNGPVSGIVVSVRGLGRAFEASTDARGQYEVTVPPGRTRSPPSRQLASLHAVCSRPSSCVTHEPASSPTSASGTTAASAESFGTHRVRLPRACRSS